MEKKYIKIRKNEICDFMFRLVSNLSDLAPQFLPPANVVYEGYVFTGVCLSMGGCAIPSCIAGGIPACLAVGLGGGLSQHALQVSRPTPKGEG